MMVVLKLSTIFVFCSLCAVGFTSADNMYFSRDAKWTNLAASGGSLVSGRGNYRPGFLRQGTYDPRMYMVEPLFAFKRSQRILSEFQPLSSSRSTLNLPQN